MRAKEFITESNIGDEIENKLGLQTVHVFEKGDDIILQSLIVGKNKQGQGLGTKAMELLCDYADDNNKRIVLTPGSKDVIHGTTSRNRLVRFYKQFGFKESKGKNIDYSIGAGKMYRDPKTTMDEMALPADWDESMLGHDKSFAKRIRYAKDHAKSIGRGSSRVAFIIPDNGRDTVVKIAKNAKGMAQNEAELEILDDGYLGRLPIVIPLVDYDKKNPQPTWIQTELATKVREKQLCSIMKCKSLNDLVVYVKHILSIPDIHGVYAKNIPNMMQQMGYSDEDIETFKEYASELADLVNSSWPRLEVDDLSRAANWGLYQGRPVVIDLGYNEEISGRMK